ncbi:hypothetical protein LXA26_18175, partial [Erwinia amylovora]|uniref:hypothetical protein n=1 Tax=Erwinia amylovora TaxID=552 RepID=UPI0020BDFC6F
MQGVITKNRKQKKKFIKKNPHQHKNTNKNRPIKKKTKKEKLETSKRKNIQNKTKFNITCCCVS